MESIVFTYERYRQLTEPPTVDDSISDYLVACYQHEPFYNRDGELVPRVACRAQLLRKGQMTHILLQLTTPVLLRALSEEDSAFTMRAAILTIDLAEANPQWNNWHFDNQEEAYDFFLDFIAVESDFDFDEEEGEEEAKGNDDPSEDEEADTSESSI